MRYLDALAAVRSDLDTPDAGLAARAAWRLALLAWRELADANPDWERLGAELLAVSDLLPELAEVAVYCDVPDRDERQTWDAVAELVVALAIHLDREVADADRPLAHRLAADAAADRLRLAVARPP
jgi:hypothetical protein